MSRTHSIFRELNLLCLIIRIIVIHSSEAPSVNSNVNHGFLDDNLLMWVC